MVWLKGPTHSVLFNEALLLECLASLLYFDDGVSLYNEYTLHSRGVLPCTHMGGGGAGKL
jgi:hypothetical protein